MADTLTLTSKDNGRTIEGLFIDGLRNAINADGADDITLRRCTFLNCGGGAVGMIRCHRWLFDDCDVHGAGLTEWNLRGADCFTIKQSADLLFNNCRVSGASHDLFTVLDGIGGELTWRHCVFGKLDSRCRAIGNGASHFTIKRHVNGVLVEDCYFTGAPDAYHSVPNTEDGKRIHAGAVQLSGEKHRFLRNVMERNAIGLLLSSDSSGQVLKDCLFQDLYILDCALIPNPTGDPGCGIMMQQGGPAGSIANNVFERVQVWGAQQLTHLALPGVGADLAGNQFLDGRFGAGPLIVAGGSFPTVEAASSRFPSFKTSRTITARPTPGTPPPGNGDPPANGDPMLKSISPQPCQPGDTLTLVGPFRAAPIFVILPTTDHPTGERFTPSSASATEAKVLVPKTIIDGGEVWLTFAEGKRSNHLPLKVGSTPPVPVPVILGYSGGALVVHVEPGAAFNVDGAQFQGATAAWNGNALEVLEQAPIRLRVKAPVSEGTAPVVVSQGGKSATGPLLTVRATVQPPPPPTDGAPAITSIFFVQGLPGDRVTLTGRGFGASGWVWFTADGLKGDNHAAAQNIGWSDTQIVCLVPQGVKTGPLYVERLTPTAGKSNSLAFTLPAPVGDPERVIVLGNAQRAAVGVAPLEAEGRLMNAAGDFAQMLTTMPTLSHVGSDGSTFIQRIERAGYTDYRTAGENIARSYSSPESVIAAWMDSPGHRENLLNPAFKKIGVGVAKGVQGTQWTQDFAG